MGMPRRLDLGTTIGEYIHHKIPERLASRASHLVPRMTGNVDDVAGTDRLARLRRLAALDPTFAINDVIDLLGVVVLVNGRGLAGLDHRDEYLARLGVRTVHHQFVTML